MSARARVPACRGLSMAVETYLDGELEPGQIVDVEAHLAECATCREHVALHRATRTSMRASLRVAAPEALREKLLARMASDRAIVAAPPSEIRTPVAVATPARRLRSVGPMRARYAVPFVLAAAAAFAITVRTPPSANAPTVSAAPSLHPDISAASFGLDGILDDLVSQHASPLPSEVSHQEEVRRFDAFVGVPVEPPKFQPFGARWEGARITPIRDSRAAMLQYSLAGGHRVTVYVYDPSRVRGGNGESRHLTPRIVRSTSVLVGNMRGYNVAATERRGVGYALATDLGEPESVELAMAGSPNE